MCTNASARCGISMASGPPGCDIGLPLFECQLVYGRQQSRQFAQVGELDIGNWMTCAERPLVAVDPDGADAGVAGASDVAVETVANHHRFMRRDSQSLQRQLKNSDVGFPESVIARDYDRFEKAREV